MDKHSYVKLIEYSLEHPRFTKEQACIAADLSHEQFDFIRREIFVLSAAQEGFVRPNEEQEWKLTPQSYFNYLQYCAYKHAISTSNRAHILSIGAIIISILIAAAPIIINTLANK